MILLLLGALTLLVVLGALGAFSRAQIRSVKQFGVWTVAIGGLALAMLLFFTGYSRNASDILEDQDRRTKQADSSMVEGLHYVKDLGVRSRQALEQGRTRVFGEIMHEHWEHKRARSSGMSNPQIDDWYQLGRDAGAIGGKLVGAGGGGFLLVYAQRPEDTRQAMAAAGASELPFDFEFRGAIGNESS